MARCPVAVAVANSQRVVEPNMPNELQSMLESAATHAPETAASVQLQLVATTTCGGNSGSAANARLMHLTG